MAESRTRAPAEAGPVELVLHTACVKAGAYALAHRVIRALPLAKPFLAPSLRKNLSGNTPAKIQARLIRDIYRRYGLKPANWEIAAILAVADAGTPQLLDGAAIERRLRRSLGETASRWLMRLAPLAQWAPELLAEVARTWAIGRYADSVGRVRKLGSDWLPAPLSKNLKLPASLLWNWSEEAFELALPALKRLQHAGRRFKRG
ncbi:MAG: hypothetical protein ACKOXG_06585 [Arenimonas sp.]